MQHKHLNKSNIASQFALQPLPLYTDTPRPLKSLEVGVDPMAPPLTMTTTQLSKDQFVTMLHQELEQAGVDDMTGNITAKLLEKCAKDGLYMPPTPDLLEGVILGWHSKPAAPSVSEAFEHAQLDFQTEILRILRESEERVKRLINVKTMEESSSIAALSNVPGVEQYKNISDPAFQFMIWVVCYVFNLAEVNTVLNSPNWEETINHMIKKKWGEWGKKVYEKHKGERKNTSEIAEKTMITLMKLPPFKDGKVEIPKVRPLHYKNMKEFSDAMGRQQKYLERAHGKIQEKKM